ncbi:MAG: hypothetical protein ACPGTU_08175 [Myxococcota bacterium]
MYRSLGTLILMGFGCGQPPSPREPDLGVGEVQATSGEFSHSSEWDSNFPAEADLAILLDTQDDPLIDFETRTEFGERLLPRMWLNSVKKAYTGTFAEDAIEDENIDEEWRLVSVRVSPCAPIGIRPDVDIDQWCWPTVRLVWQPVVQNFRLRWGVLTDFYADDRAIHAIYPVAPRLSTGEHAGGAIRDTVATYLSQDRPVEGMQNHIRNQFDQARDSSARAVLSALHSLRDPRLSSQSYQDLNVRPETYQSESIRTEFRDNLRWFLSQFARPHDLDELTSFSLPEGRSPAESDLWIFVGFDGNQGRPTLKELNVIGRNSGNELVRIGASQTVSVGVEDQTVEEEMERGNDELVDSVIVTSDDIETMGDAMADPYQFLVPNTSCASCHRLNPLRFDFHSLSGFEDRGISISPRVEMDVARDMVWSHTRLRR